MLSVGVFPLGWYPLLLSLQNSISWYMKQRMTLHSWRECPRALYLVHHVSNAIIKVLLFSRVMSFCSSISFFLNSSSGAGDRNAQQLLCAVVKSFVSHVKINKKRPLGFQTALCSHLASKKGSFNLTQPHFSNTWFLHWHFAEKVLPKQE